MKNAAEDKVSKFYNTIGWETNGGITEDANKFEDLRECADVYVRKCRLRVLKYIDRGGDNLLDMASGPIQYKEYLEYSRNYKKRYCVDLSSKALELAEKKIAEHGVYLCGSFFDMNFEDNYFDGAISLHTIYHIDKDKQEEAVRKLIRVTKPGRNIVVVYNNPDTLLDIFKAPFVVLRNILNNSSKRSKQERENDLYFSPHPIYWWKRFSDVADIQIMPWRSFSSEDQKRLIPDNAIGKMMFKILFIMEDRFPELFVKYFEYPMIILTKKLEIV